MSSQALKDMIGHVEQEIRKAADKKALMHL